MYQVYVYGIGSNTRRLLEYLDRAQVDVSGFIETQRTEAVYNGKEVIEVKEVQRLVFDYIIIGSTMYEEEMLAELVNAGVKEEKIIKGRLDKENIVKNSHIFNLNKFIIYQNEKLAVEIRNIKWRNIFWDYAKGVSWFNERTPLTAGGWSVQYDYLFMLISILNIIKPQRVLECGLGETSKIIMQYAENSGCEYEVCEQSRNWVEVFEQKYGLSENMRLHVLPIEDKYIGKYDLNVEIYRDFSEVVNGKYDLISIDGPIGTEGFSRIDILGCLPKCLNDKFCILIDDYNRIGEQRMVEELKEVLHSEDIGFVQNIFGIDRKVCLICSNEYQWLTTYLPE